MATNAKRKNLEHLDPSEVDVMRDKIRKLEATLETTVKAKDEKEKELMSKIEELQMFKYDQVDYETDETQANEVLDILFVFMENNGFKGIAFKIFSFLDCGSFVQCRRVCRSWKNFIDNEWYKTIARDDVSLVDSPIKSFTEKGILTEDGIEHEFDVIIYATGFNTNRFLWPMDVTGIEGKNLEELWGETPEAYKGILVPGYPNLFCLYGPNTNIVHGGSIIYNTECQVHYMMQCIALMAEKEAREFEVSAEINDQYNKEVQELSQQLAWGHSGVQSWYKNSQGRVVNNSPFSNLEYWSKTHDIEPEAYDLS